MERDGSRAVAGEAVVAEEGTGFRRTTSVFGTETVGRFGGFVEVGGLRLEVSRREGRPRSIMLHFSTPWVHCSPLNAVVEFQTPKEYGYGVLLRNIINLIRKRRLLGQKVLICRPPAPSD